MNFNDMQDAVKFYISQGFRVMPLHGIDEGCQHKPAKPLLDCKGQCLGKVPKEEHWPDREFFTPDDFTPGSNLAIIMGKQLDGRWLVGLDVDGYLELDRFMMLPPTLECITNRGRHLIFEVEPDSPLGNWNDILSTRSKTDGYKQGFSGALDLKYCRGAMASPPSKTKSGGEYGWIEWRQPEMLPRSEVQYLIRKRKLAFPHIERFSKWSQNPGHKNKNP